MHHRLPAERQKIQTEKEKNMKNKQHDSAPHKEHAPGWNEKLAVG